MEAEPESRIREMLSALQSDRTLSTCETLYLADLLDARSVLFENITPVVPDTFIKSELLKIARETQHNSAPHEEASSPLDAYLAARKRRFKRTHPSSPVRFQLTNLTI